MANMSKKITIRKYSNPTTVYRLAKKYLGKTAKISELQGCKVHNPNFVNVPNCLSFHLL